MSNTDFSLPELLQDPSFRAWATGEADPETKRFWDQWVQSSPERRQLARKAQHQIIGFSFSASDAPDTTAAWNKLDRRLEGALSTRTLTQPERPSNRWFYAMAASIVLLLAVGVSYFVISQRVEQQDVQYSQKVVTTDFGERKKITLSDGSAIVLNAHSTLSYVPNRTMKDGVHIRLEGEAYFTVAKRLHEEDLPFTVSTNDGRVSVLGTQFVVSTRNKHTEVVLERGRVAIDQKDVRHKDNKVTYLKPNQMASFSRTGKRVQVRRVNTNVYTSWTTNFLEFDHTPFAEVQNRLENTFGVHFVVRDSAIYHRKLSGSIENAGLPVITSVLAKAWNVSFSMKGDTVYVGHHAAGE